MARTVGIGHQDFETVITKEDSEVWFCVPREGSTDWGKMI